MFLNCLIVALGGACGAVAFFYVIASIICGVIAVFAAQKIIG